MPAAFVMARRSAPRTHAGLEADRVSQHEIGAAHGLALGQRKQRGEHRRARMQHHAAHMGVVVVEHVAHLAVGERRVEQTELQAAAEHGRLRLARNLLQHRKQRGDGLMPAAGERAADPIEHAAPRLADRGRGNVLEPRRRQMAAQRFRQRFCVGFEVLVHGGALPSALYDKAPDAALPETYIKAPCSGAAAGDP